LYPQGDGVSSQLSFLSHREGFTFCRNVRDQPMVSPPTGFPPYLTPPIRRFFAVVGGPVHGVFFPSGSFFGRKKGVFSFPAQALYTLRGAPFFFPSFFWGVSFFSFPLLERAGADLSSRTLFFFWRGVLFFREARFLWGRSSPVCFLLRFSLEGGISFFRTGDSQGSTQAVFFLFPPA